MYMLNTKGAVRFSIMFLALAFVAIVVGVVFRLSSLSSADGPPSFHPGASLFKGSLVADKLAYYYVGKEISVDDLLKCIGPAAKTGFVYYSSGDGLRNEGYYTYNIADNDNQATVISDPFTFYLYPFRLFGLVANGKVDAKCAAPVTQVSKHGLDSVLRNFATGWVQVVGVTDKLVDSIRPYRSRISEAWVQDGVNSFDKINIDDLENEEFPGDYYGLWLKLYQN